jgi:hypothetical protein
MRGTLTHSNCGITYQIHYYEGADGCEVAIYGDGKRPARYMASFDIARDFQQQEQHSVLKTLIELAKSDIDSGIIQGHAEGWKDPEEKRSAAASRQRAQPVINWNDDDLPI